MRLEFERCFVQLAPSKVIDLRNTAFQPLQIIRILYFLLPPYFFRTDAFHCHLFFLREAAEIL